MDARPAIVEIGRHLRALDFDVVLIGNAAAALQGAPVTTVDFDFMFRKSPRNIVKLKALARALDAVVLRPFYPVSDLFRVVRDDDGLQLDFMATIHGVRSYAGLRDRSTEVTIDDVVLRVASLDDIILDSRTVQPPARRPARTILAKSASQGRLRSARLAAVKAESERALDEMIRRWQALPPGKRTHFLRKRVGICRTAL